MSFTQLLSSDTKTGRRRILSTALARAVIRRKSRAGAPARGKKIAHRVQLRRSLSKRVLYGRVILSYYSYYHSESRVKSIYKSVEREKERDVEAIGASEEFASTKDCDGCVFEWGNCAAMLLVVRR
jgi:hypothetical protein